MRNLKWKYYQPVLLVIYFLVFIISLINPIFPHEMWLQHSITILMAVFLIIVAHKNALSDISFSLLVLFMILHIIGARWIYSYVPYDRWFQFLLGISIDEYFGFTRNHYDRFVHFMYGLLVIIPLAEIFSTWFRSPKTLSWLTAWLFILASGSVYEVFEWSLSIFLSPEDAEAYNGQQGDFWDAQKDLGLNMLGGTVTIVAYAVLRNRISIWKGHS